MKPMTAEWIAKFAVAFRYPGTSAEAESAADAERRCRRFRGMAREALGSEM